MAIPTTEPLQLQAGDLVQWTRQLDDYPAGTWTLSYVLLNGSSKITFSATASGTTHSISLSAAVTGAYAAGTYRYQAYVTSGANRVKVGEGTIDVLANFAGLTTLETRSQAKQVLDAIEAEILARSTGGMTSEYSIGNRSLKKEPISSLIILRDKYKAIVRSEENAERLSKGLGLKNKLLVRL